jgi:hypothetical protein
VTRTEGLMLATPPPGEMEGMVWGAGGAAAGGEGAMDEDVGMGGAGGGGDMEVSVFVLPLALLQRLSHPPLAQMDSQMNHSDPPPANYHPPSSFQTHSHYRPDPPHVPHHAPPLHQHLAGSPQASESLAPTSMSRSSSSSSSLGGSEMDISSYHHQAQQKQPPPLLAAGVPSLSAGQKRTGGGWKVTFGFRHDCQKCLQKVPGHYSHVVSDDGVFAGQ